MKTLLACLLTISLGVQAVAQIRVNVDQRPVVFQGAQPQRVEGRVMVPLRGVLEAMGAEVEFFAATGGIVARRGSTRVEMRLGDRIASVNGNEITLDVPAMSVGGRTMVPLRFVGEAMGADVRWSNATQTVDISTYGGNPGGGGGTTGGGGGTTGGGGGTTGGGGGTTPVEIFEINVNRNGEWLGPGDTLDVTLKGTAGAQASFRIIGLIDRVAMRETTAGTYKGSWVVPKGANLSGARVLGELTRGTEQKLIQGGEVVNVDSTPPKITSVSPDDKARVPSNRLSVTAVFEDGAGSGIQPQNVVLKVDGQNVVADSTLTSSFISWRPDRPLAAGRHTASLAISDLAGNMVSRAWEFTVSDASTAVQSFTHDASNRVEPGDVITATLKGERQATVTFAIGAKTGIPMRETTEGTYVGEYVVRRGDSLNNAQVVATVRTAAGETYTVQADRKINATAIKAEAVKITSHEDGDPAPSSIILKGTAGNNARVVVKVTYSMTVLGGLRLNGALYEQEVTANSQGAWSTESIRLRTPVSGNNTEYTVTATLVVGEGETQPEPTTIKLIK